MTLSKDIRKTFLDYFKKNGHTHVDSYPLVPKNDPSLMFTNSGMVQFKNYFTQEEKPNFSRATTAQKCVRAGGKHNDLDNVGYTARHHTFFEMMGNFSFGDYFKEDACKFAWDLLTSEYGLDPAKLYLTVFHDDEEAFKIWKKITNFSDDKIIKISTNDNFWSMGDTGPCGPCSEIFYDHGPDFEGGLPGTPEEDGDRFIEIWNLVFMQFEDTKNNGRIALPKPCIDTGMGLERMAAILQGKNSNFDIDLFQNLINKSKSLTRNNTDSNSHKVIADHIRSSSFIIADGVMPSNEGRGYVLRRILRRAMRHIHKLGSDDIILDKIVPTLVDDMGADYPELIRAQKLIESTLESEEKRFKLTLDKGMKILSDELKNLAEKDILDGKVAFTLYDTYGFPLDLTKDILREKNITVDEESFNDCMKLQKEKSKASWSGSGEQAHDNIWFEISELHGETEFVGHNKTQAITTVIDIVQDGKRVSEVSDGEAIVVLHKTPFYAESGGQIGDIGSLNDNKVLDTKKYLDKVFGHHINVLSPIKVGDNLEAKIDDSRRAKIKANHSATHLLHYALRDVLGEHVTQKGSIVRPDKLRFDFSHNNPLRSDEIKKVERIVNEKIIENSQVNTKLSTPKQAVEDGAMALFGEKYGDEVRVVKHGAIHRVMWWNTR